MFRIAKVYSVTYSLEITERHIMIYDISYYDNQITRDYTVTVEQEMSKPKGEQLV